MSVEYSFARPRARLVVDVERVANLLPAERQVRDRAGRRGAWQGFEPREQRSHEVPQRRVVAVPAFRHHHAHRQDVFGANAGVDLQQPLEAATEEAGAHQQHHRESDLRDDEDAAEPIAPGRRTPIASRVACARFKADAVTAGAVPKRTPVSSDMTKAKPSTRPSTRTSSSRGSARSAGSSRTSTYGAAHASDQPEHAGDNGQQQALGQHLPDQPSARGPERKPHGDLRVTRGGAGKEQVGDVDAGDEQEQADGSEQNEKRGPGIAGDLLVHGHDGRTPIGVSGVRACEAAGDAGHLGARLLHGCAGAETRNHLQVAPARIPLGTAPAATDPAVHRRIGMMQA